MLSVGLIVFMKDTKLPTCVMFAEFMRGAVSVWGMKNDLRFRSS